MRVAFYQTALCAALAVSPALASAQEPTGRDEPVETGAIRPSDDAESAASVLEGWPAKTRDVADKMMEQYGEPTGVTPNLLATRAVERHPPFPEGDRPSLPDSAQGRAGAGNSLPRAARQVR